MPRPHPPEFRARAVLREQLPQVSRVEILSKRARHRNEMASFRYDVLLHIGAHVDTPLPVEFHRWPEDERSTQWLETLLATSRSMVGVCDIPNARTAEAARLAHLLAARGGPPDASACARGARAAFGLEPEDLHALAARHGYGVALSWAGHGSDGHFDAVFAHGDVPSAAIAWPVRSTPTRAPLTNDPLGGHIRREQAHHLVPALRRLLRDELPEYMVPAAFVVVDALPLNANGKVDRAALPVPTATRADLAVPYVAPGDDDERALAEIWETVLGIERVGVDDDFFDLGGHSLLATQVVSRIRTNLGVELPLSVMFECATVAEQARALEQERRLATSRPVVPPLVPASREIEIPPSTGLQFLSLTEGMFPGMVLSPSFVITLTYHVHGPLDVGALERAIAEVVARQEVLRSTCRLGDDGMLRQVIHPDVSVPLRVVDFSGSEAADPRNLDAMHELTGPLDLERPPWIKAGLIRRAEDDHTFILAVHHLLCDGWSLTVIQDELAALYDAFRRDQPSPLPDLPVQYADYAIWQHETYGDEASWAEGTPLHRALEYWRGRLEGLRQVAFPVDHPERSGEVELTLHQVLLPDDLVEAFSRLDREHAVTPFVTHFAAFLALLHVYTGATDIALPLPEANRRDQAVERVVGWFLEPVILRADLAGDPTFRELLLRTRDAVVEAFSALGLPFLEQLARIPGLIDEMARTAATWVNFNYEPRLDVLELAGLTVEPAWTVTDWRGKTGTTAPAGLNLSVVDTGTGRAVKVIYNAAVYTESTIESLIGRYVAVVETIAGDQDVRLSELVRMLSPVTAAPVPRSL
jgi:acyl carrier protein